MTPSQREVIRRELIDRLTAIYRTVRGEIKDVVGGEPIEGDPIDEAEEGVIDELRAFESSMEERDRQLAHAIEDALQRLRTNGDFGICVDCGREIPFERLRMVPWTQRCADDEARFERDTTPHHHPTL
jgi:DnaK suppressor protein